MSMSLYGHGTNHSMTAPLIEEIHGNTVTLNLIQKNSGTPTVYAVRTYVSSVNPIMEITINSNPNSNLTSTMEYFTFSVMNPLSLESEILGPIYVSTPGMKKDENLNNFDFSSTQSTDRKYRESVQSMIEKLSFFHLFAEKVLVTKVMMKIEKTLIVKFKIIFINMKLPEIFNLKFESTLSSIFKDSSANVYQIIFPNKIGGNFRLTLGGYVTKNLLYNSSAEIVRDALLELPSIGEDSLSVGMFNIIIIVYFII